mmetsp:Transcript_60192/g.186774  ORF Transcript_60192/g.186774 Transcript_60192/m.186774 type:complete len:236 (-) Transcript_60192:32-739(-)
MEDGWARVGQRIHQFPVDDAQVGRSFRGLLRRHVVRVTVEAWYGRDRLRHLALAVYHRQILMLQEEVRVPVLGAQALALGIHNHCGERLLIDHAQSEGSPHDDAAVEVAPRRAAGGILRHARRRALSLCVIDDVPACSPFEGQKGLEQLHLPGLEHDVVGVENDDHVVRLGSVEHILPVCVLGWAETCRPDYFGALQAEYVRREAMPRRGGERQGQARVKDAGVGHQVQLRVPAA